MYTDHQKHTHTHKNFGAVLERFWLIARLAWWWSVKKTVSVRPKAGDGPGAVHFGVGFWMILDAFSECSVSAKEAIGCGAVSFWYRFSMIFDENQLKNQLELENQLENQWKLMENQLKIN